MKNIYIVFILFSGLLLSLPSKSDSYEGYQSSVKGVGLWYINNSVQILSVSKNPEFISFCNGKNRLYLFESNEESGVCQTVEWIRSENKFIPQKLSFDQMRNSEDDEYFIELNNGQFKSYGGSYIVSTVKLNSGNVSISDVPQAGLNDNIKKSILDNIQQLMKEIDKQVPIPSPYESSHGYKIVLGDKDADIRKLNEWRGKEKDHSYTLRFKEDTQEIFLIPTLYQFALLGGNLISSVVTYKNNEYKFLGFVYGFLQSIGPDIDGDSIPELVMDKGDIDGKQINYMKIYPNVDSLIVYQHY